MNPRPRNKDANDQYDDKIIRISATKDIPVSKAKSRSQDLEKTKNKKTKLTISQDIDKESEKERGKLCNLIDISLRKACYFHKNGIICSSLESLYDDEIIKTINYLMNTESSLKNYGFYFKKICEATDDRRSISDLWGWLKKLVSLKLPKDMESYNVLEDVYFYIQNNLNHSTRLINGFEVIDANLSIFDVLGWHNTVYEAELAKNENFTEQLVKIKKTEFTRSIAIMVMHFNFEDAAKTINTSSEFKTSKYIKELKFIYECLLMICDFQKASARDYASNEYKIIQKCIKSLEIEEPYLKFIQLMLSGDFIKSKKLIFDLRGVNFFDKLLFILRFLYRDAKVLIEEYMRKASKKGNLEILALYSKDPDTTFNVLQTYLDKTQDLITVGLSSLILNELYPNSKLNKFIDHCYMFLNDLYLFNLKGNINKQLNDLRKDIPRSEKGGTNISASRLNRNAPLINCYYCDKSPVSFNVYGNESLYIKRGMLNSIQ